MKLGILAVLLVTILAMPAMAYEWIVNTTNGHRYSLTNTSGGTWIEAEAEAMSLGGHLATVRSLSEDQWIRTTFGTHWFWIGLCDTQNEGMFVWVKGEPITYTNWNVGEPNNQNKEDFVGMNVGETRGWNDFPDWYRMYGVIEVVPVPEPTGLLALGASSITLILLKRRKR